jgi:hypothetical protein
MESTETVFSEIVDKSNSLDITEKLSQFQQDDKFRCHMNKIYKKHFAAFLAKAGKAKETKQSAYFGSKKTTQATKKSLFSEDRYTDFLRKELKEEEDSLKETTSIYDRFYNFKLKFRNEFPKVSCTKENECSDSSTMLYYM